MKRRSELTREQLEGIVGQVRDILWRDPFAGSLDPGSSWDIETIEWVSGVLEDAGLRPDRSPPASPTAGEYPDGSTAAMRSALEAFIATIEATGGCVRPALEALGWLDEDTANVDHRQVPTGDESWPDLADAYLLACRALGRQPLVSEADADEMPDETGGV